MKVKLFSKIIKQILKLFRDLFINLRRCQMTLFEQDFVSETSSQHKSGEFKMQAKTLLITYLFIGFLEQLQVFKWNMYRTPQSHPPSKSD